MARSPEYTLQPGQEGKDLAGVSACGCVTAALAIKFEARLAYANATEKDVREFYAEMAKSGRDVRWMPKNELTAALYAGMDCPHRPVAAQQTGEPR